VGGFSATASNGTASSASGRGRVSRRIEAWRASAGFQERVGGFQELLESFEPYTLDLAAEIGAKD